MIYDVHGPFQIPKNQRNYIDESAKSLEGFWKEVEQSCKGLSTANGCYIFSASSSGGSTIFPWYVGQTNNSFKAKSLDPRNLMIFRRIVDEYEYKRYTPYLYFIPRLTNKGKFAAGNTKAGRGQNLTLEDILIGMAYRTNSDLFNINGLKNHQNYYVPGIINAKQGGQTKAVKSLRNTLKIEK